MDLIMLSQEFNNCNPMKLLYSSSTHHHLLYKYAIYLLLDEKRNPKSHLVSLYNRSPMHLIF